jgi:hypothetical protein
LPRFLRNARRSRWTQEAFKAVVGAFALLAGITCRADQLQQPLNAGSAPSAAKHTIAHKLTPRRFAQFCLRTQRPPSHQCSPHLQSASLPPCFSKLQHEQRQPCILCWLKWLSRRQCWKFPKKASKSAYRLENPPPSCWSPQWFDAVAKAQPRFDGRGAKDSTESTALLCIESGGNYFAECTLRIIWVPLSK